MFKLFKKDKEKIFKKKSNELNKSLNIKLSHSLTKNLKILQKLFENVDTIKLRNFNNCNNKNLNFCIAYFDGTVNAQIINDNIIKPLMTLCIEDQNKHNLLDNIINSAIMINQVEKTDDFKKIVEEVTYGSTILFIDNLNQALILGTKKFELRSIEEPGGEKSLSGPREGFTESIIVNLSLISRKIRSNDLKINNYNMGNRTNTQICICYLDSLINKDILKELYDRLNKIEIDTVIDSNYISELIKDASLSPFRTTGFSERPDVIAGKLLEGRIAIFVDGTPVVLTIPYLFVENFQSSEDYYLNFYYSSFARIIRILGFFLTIAIPGFYIAIVAYHQEMLPTPLLLSIATARQKVPLPAALEIVIMLLIFDILKEAGIRMPTGVGQALSIVGALVIGQAAVDANLVAAPMIIIVAFTGITSLLIPKLRTPIIYCRILILILSTIFGIFGMFWALALIFIHILSLNSFGVPQISLSGNYNYQDIKDTFIRGPWIKMNTRTKVIAKDDIRLKSNSGEKS